jgi:hypothetical protein
VSTFFPERPFRDLRNLAEWRKTARALENEKHVTLITQLLRYGVCPCVGMGRYSTCCEKLHGLLTIRTRQ